MFSGGRMPGKIAQDLLALRKPALPVALSQYLPHAGLVGGLTEQEAGPRAARRGAGPRPSRSRRPDLGQLERERGLRLVKDYGGGVMLFRKEKK